MAAVLVVCQGVLPALPGPLMAHEADEGRAPDDVGGGGGTQKSVEGGEALWRSGPPRGEPAIGVCAHVLILLMGSSALCAHPLLALRVALCAHCTLMCSFALLCALRPAVLPFFALLAFFSYCLWAAAGYCGRVSGFLIGFLFLGFWAGCLACGLVFFPLS